MAVSNRLRFEVLRRDNYACRYCGAKAPFAELHVDHVVPRSRGGGDDPWNLTAACVDCNMAKGNGIPTDQVISEVRIDEATYQSSKGLPVQGCVHCGKPVQLDEPVEAEYPVQCEPCNAAVCEAWEAGFRQGRVLS